MQIGQLQVHYEIGRYGMRDAYSMPFVKGLSGKHGPRRAMAPFFIERESCSIEHRKESQMSLLLKPMIELSDTQNGLRGTPSRVFLLRP